MVARRIQAFGKVQGVFYRASTKNKADELELSGWVKNEPDGTVLIEAKGPKDRIESFIEWCKEGPQFAKVTSLAVEEIHLLNITEFEVRY